LCGSAGGFGGAKVSGFELVAAKTTLPPASVLVGGCKTIGCFGPAGAGGVTAAAAATGAAAGAAGALGSATVAVGMDALVDGEAAIT